MMISHRLLARLCVPLLTLLVASWLGACAIWTDGDPAPRASFSITAPSSIQRSEGLRRAVARMDVEAFPLGDGPSLRLKLSHSLSTVPSSALAQGVWASARHRG